ncbi:amino acid ABC transporter ATP-binding protein [Stigmatella aurantiaca]|uniref:Amino acid ABC transporter, ATP-binding protein n=1 Tax=Stigmatella aurantiaca (strain DW4/3-1) TaxID=378806 RepID=Q08XE5_STIAD|nr:amino acid ABC transporter ATP-binding protein [Stigmatella aurantiaca]ADO70689.1 amino acid ABC transporter, ATP-binding protein [Stigmatella aurantiaca DW4/3-1]EAU65168.1 amino acid ABC transporter, ATP-binding protein [Stigmatella aurantiaca DW4/3-1]
MIEVRGLTKRYEGRTILDGISAQFGRDEVVALVGPSGGGKSTLLRCLNGLETFDAGTVQVGEHHLSPGGAKARGKEIWSIRQRVGFVFQQWHLFSHRTALGNVIEAPMHVKRQSLREATERGRELLAKVGLSNREEAYPSELSGGEQQRVAIARALAMNPEVLLMDEPTSALDPERVGALITLLARLRTEGLSMVVVTHEMRFAHALASRVLVLHGGRIIEEGPPGEVLARPQHERTRAFLGLTPSGVATASKSPPPAGESPPG